MRRVLVLAAVVSVSCAVQPTELLISAADFGVVEPGLHHRPLQVQNLGPRPATLLRVERRAGAEGFTVTPGQVQLAAGERAPWNVSFTSTKLGLAEARFAAVFDSGTAEFTLRARVAGPCVVPQTFDVGDARVGFVATRTLTVNNPLDEPGVVFVGAPAAPFSTEPSGELRLEAHESRQISVRFSPARAGEAQGAWLLSPSTDCTVSEVQLQGLAVDAPLTFSPGRLDFGPLAPGSTRSLAVEVINHTRAPLTLNTLESSSAAFEVLTAAPLVVPAEGTASVRVEARAAGTTAFDAELRATTDAVSQPELRLPLLANRSAPCLSASVPRLDFAPTEVGCHSRDARVQLTNTCPHEVRLGDRELSTGFTFISAPSTSTLAPSSAVDFIVTHAASALGDASGTLRLSVDVLDGTQVLSLPLQGQGTAAREVEEAQLIPNALLPLDVVLVLDDSPAMLPLADSTAENLGTFALWAASYGFDFRVGVLTTSTAPAVRGRLRRTSTGEGWLDEPSVAQLQALGQTRGQSTGRSSCLEALGAAFSSPLREDPTELGGLLRPGAALYVICVTNSYDALESAPMTAISTLLSRLPRPFEISVVANFTDVAGCPAEREHGPLSALVAQTNGVMEEICTPNWSASLERIGRSAFGYRTNFYLDQHPALTRGPLHVFIDAQELPALDPQYDAPIWEYDGNVNAVLFEPLYVPEPGRTLRFRFTPDCAR